MNDRFKFRVWDNNKKEYLDKGYIHRKGYLVMPTMKNDYSLAEAEGDFIIEQCTGRKDINGTLIYEGDLVMVDGYIDKYKVIWDKEICSFAIDHIAKFLPLGSSSFASVAIPMVIIGNIHENKEEG